MDLVDFIYLFAFILRACGEFLWSTLAFWRTVRDRTELYYIDSPRNAQILAACPSLQTFTPWRCAAGPRIQTVLAKCCMPRAKQPYRQELVTLSDGVCVRLDWKEHSSTEATAPICFIAHGLGGDSDSPYAAVLAEECAKRGWRAVVYLRRGHGGLSLLPAGVSAAGVSKAQEANGATAAEVDIESPAADSPAGFAVPDATPLSPKSARIFPRHWDDDDMHHVVQHVRNLYPGALMFAIGFSCGGNLVANYQATHAGSTPFVAAASVGNGYDLVSGLKLLAGSKWADGVVVTFLKDIFVDRYKEIKAIAAAQNVKLDMRAIKRSRSLRHFESLIMPAAYGYADVDDYLHQNTCHWRLGHISRPLLCLANYDDPLVHEDLPQFAIKAARENPHIITAVTQHGGHIGWYTGFRQTPWWVTVWFEYVEAILKQQQYTRGMEQDSGDVEQCSGGVKQYSGDLEVIPKQQFSGGAEQYTGGAQQYRGDGQRYTRGAEQYSDNLEAVPKQQYNRDLEQHTGDAHQHGGDGLQCSGGVTAQVDPSTGVQQQENSGGAPHQEGTSVPSGIQGEGLVESQLGATMVKQHVHVVDAQVQHTMTPSAQAETDVEAGAVQAEGAADVCAVLLNEQQQQGDMQTFTVHVT